MYPPRQVLFFEASKAVAKSDSTEIQQKISEYMNSESFWSEFLDLQSQDIGFRANLADFYTRVFQSTSPKILPFIRKLLLGDVQSQRAASEILSGIIRASKQYSNEDLDLLDEVYEIIISAMENATHETYHIWINCLMYFTKNRDPNRFQRLIERLGNVEEFGTESFVVARKIMWAQILILAFKGRLYLNVLPKVVWSPYEQVRGASGRLIDTCLHFREIGFLDFDDLLKSNGFELENEAVIEKLFFDLKTWKQLPQNETGNSLYSNAIKTVLCWFQSALKTSIAASIEPFLPTLLKLTLETCAQDYSDPDLLEMSSLVLKQYPLFQHSPKTLSRTIQILIKSCNSSWHIKTKVLTIVEHLFFTHVLLITPLNKNEILTLLKTLLEDQQLEVRIQAGNTLSYVIRCSDESVISDLKDEYMKLMKQKLPLKKDVSAQEYQKLIIKRHGVVMAISALILAFPYDMPNWMTSLLVEMAGCFNEPGVISSSVMSVFREFKRTHMDNWEGEKTKFTEEELEAISDLLYSPGYYA
jgi:proteasome activator subunit 4